MARNPTPAPRNAPAANPANTAAPDAARQTGTDAAANTDAASTGVSGEMRQAERDVLDLAPATGDKTAQDRPNEMEGTRDAGPAAAGEPNTAIASLVAGGHNEDELRRSLPVGFGEPSRREQELLAMSEYEPDVLADLLLDRHGSLVRHSSGLWGAPGSPVDMTSTGNGAPASTITDVIVNKLIADGRAREGDTLRGRPRTVVKIEAPADAPIEGPASSSPS